MSFLQALGKNKDGWGAVQSIVSSITSILTVAGLLAAAGWFLMQGQLSERLVLDQTVHVFDYENTLHRRLLSVSVSAKNTGFVPVHINCARVQITELIPDYKQEHGAKDGNCNVDLKEVEIDPNEVDQIYREFYIPDSVTAVRVSTFLPRERKPSESWYVVSTADFPPVKASPPVKTNGGMKKSEK
jgi:hypothetical protein